MRKNKYLDFHVKNFGKDMPLAGLCSNFGEEDRALKTLTPTEADISKLVKEDYTTTWWGGGCKWDDDYFAIRYAYTPLRQTIVLFMSMLKKEELYEKQ